MNEEDASRAPPGDLTYWLGRVLWLVLISWLCCFVLLAVIDIVLKGGIEQGRLGILVRFTLAFVLAPALIWGGVLAFRAMRSKPLNSAQHIAMAGLVAMMSLPATVPVTWLLLPQVPDSLGLEGILALLFGLALIVVFPLLSVVFVRYSSKLPCGDLFLVEAENVNE